MLILRYVKAVHTGLDIHDEIERSQFGNKFTEQLLSTIAISKELLGLTYDQILKMPLKEFYSLLKIRAQAEKEKSDYIKQQQQQATAQMKSQNKKIKY